MWRRAISWSPGSNVREEDLMAHTHSDAHTTHHDVDVIETGAAPGAGPATGVLVVIATLLIVALIAFAVLWTRPWGGSSSHTTPNNQGIGDNRGGGCGGSAGGSDSGGGSQSGGGAQPSQ